MFFDIGGAASATVTNMLYYVQNGGLAPLASAASAILTTATYSVIELEPFSDECYFHSRPVDSPAAARTPMFAISRSQIQLRHTRFESVR